MTDTDLRALSAAEAAAKIAQGEVTSEQLVTAYLDHIGALEPQVLAIAHAVSTQNNSSGRSTSAIQLTFTSQRAQVQSTAGFVFVWGI